MAIADDAKLIQMAAERAGRLFPSLDRSGAFTPLVVLLAVLPGLYALEHRTLDDAGALWGLKGLAIVSASEPDSVIEGGIEPDRSGIEPDRSGIADELRWQPPLGSWLTAVAMWVVGTSRPVSLVLVSYLSTAGLVGMVFVLFRRLAGPRFGFWTALLAACHGPLLAQAQKPAPLSLAMLLALTTFWGFLSHLLQATRPERSGSMPVSLKLLTAGVAWGLCLLAGGPLAIVVVGILLVHILGLRRDNTNSRPERSGSMAERSGSMAERSGRMSGSSTVEKRVWDGWPALGSLLVLALSGFAVGGWWVMMMSSRYGEDFWVGWLTGSRRVPGLDWVTSPAFSEKPGLYDSLQQFIETPGVLVGLCLFGLWRACCEVCSPNASPNEPRRRRLQFLVVWLGCGLAVGLTSLGESAAAAFHAELWQAFVLIPCIALVAFAIEEISQRRVHMLLVVGLVCAPLIALEWRYLSSWPDPDALFSKSWLVMLSIFVLAGVGWWLHGYCRSRDHRQRFVLTLLIVALVVVNSRAGLRSVRLTNANDRAIWLFGERLREHQDVDFCMLISAAERPTRLRFLVRSIWPHAVLSVRESWVAAFSQVRTDPRCRQSRVLVFVDWGAHQTRPANLGARRLQVKQISPPEYFQRRPLRAYVLANR